MTDPKSGVRQPRERGVPAADGQRAVADRRIELAKYAKHAIYAKYAKYASAGELEI